MKAVSLLCLTSITCTLAAADSSVIFRPCPKVAVEVTANKSSLDYTIIKSGLTAKKIFSLDIETTPYLELSDFNFDGLQDFSVWYLDEGMGKYTIHRLFLFDPKSKDFVEARPRCGDEFLNLRVHEAKRELISTYYINGQAMTCSTRLQKLGRANRKAPAR